jgi:hypothetical protein
MFVSQRTGHIQAVPQHRESDHGRGGGSPLPYQHRRLNHLPTVPYRTTPRSKPYPFTRAWSACFFGVEIPRSGIGNVILPTVIAGQLSQSVDVAAISRSARRRPRVHPASATCTHLWVLGKLGWNRRVSLIKTPWPIDCSLTFSRDTC